MPSADSPLVAASLRASNCHSVSQVLCSYQYISFATLYMSRHHHVHNVERTACMSMCSTLNCIYIYNWHQPTRIAFTFTTDISLLHLHLQLTSAYTNCIYIYNWHQPTAFTFTTDIRLLHLHLQLTSAYCIYICIWHQPTRIAFTFTTEISLQEFHLHLQLTSPYKNFIYVYNWHQPTRTAFTFTTDIRLQELHLRLRLTSAYKNSNLRNDMNVSHYRVGWGNGENTRQGTVIRCHLCWIIVQMGEDDLKDLWRHYQTRSKQVYHGITGDGWGRRWYPVDMQQSHAHTHHIQLQNLQ